MNKNSIINLKAILAKPTKIAIITHKNPDGDALGSTLALFQVLQKLGHQTTPIVPNTYPDFLSWIPGEENLFNFEKNKQECIDKINEAELIFTLDFNDFSRAGKLEDVLKNASAKFAMIDHHQQPSDYAEFVYSDDQIGSTCEMIYHFMHKIDQIDLLDADIATCIYLGIMTDTGSFRFPSTTSTTHRVVADLIDAGANNSNIHQNTYDVNSYSRMQLLGTALNNLKVAEKFHTAYISLSQQELDDHHFKKGDTEGFVNYGLSLNGIKFAVIFIENKQEKIVKISFRSKGDFDVNQFARNHFSGGGHKNAAGGMSPKNLDETISDFINLLPQYQENLQ
ncbi:MAG: DHH family phosphoesterase [Bacteroidota bacterium]